MKKSFWLNSKLAALILMAGTVLVTTGCGKKTDDGKKPAAEKKAGKPSAIRKPALPSLESAVERTFGLKPGYDASKKQFIVFVTIDLPDKNQPDSITLRHQDQIELPGPEQALHGAVLALGDFAETINSEIGKTESPAATVTTVRSDLKFGKLRLKRELVISGDANTQTETALSKIVITQDKNVLYLSEIDTAKGKTLFRHHLKTPDMNQFCAEMASNGLQVTLLGWSRNNGELRMAYSIQLLETMTAKITSASKAKFKQISVEVRKETKKGMLKMSEKLKEWGQEND